MNKARVFIGQYEGNNAAAFRDLIQAGVQSLEETADTLTIDPSDDPPVLIWSNEHGSWWKENEAGYTASIDEAGVYTLSQAKEICNAANRNMTGPCCPHETICPIPPTTEN